MKQNGEIVRRTDSARRPIDADTESRILDAANGVFMRRGTAGARMTEIAREAGVNHALVHYYFRSKQRLAEAVFRRAIGQFFPVDDRRAHLRAPLEEKVRSVAAAQIDMLLKNRELPGYLLAELNHYPERAEQLLESMAGTTPASLRVRLFGTLGRQLEDAAREGVIRPIRAAGVRPQPRLHGRLSLRGASARDGDPGAGRRDLRRDDGAAEGRDPVVLSRGAPPMNARTFLACAVRRPSRSRASAARRHAATRCRLDELQAAAGAARPARAAGRDSRVAVGASSPLDRRRATSERHRLGDWRSISRWSPSSRPCRAGKARRSCTTLTTRTSTLAEPMLDPTRSARVAAERAQLARARADVATALYALRQEVNASFFTAAALSARHDAVTATIADLEAQARVVDARVRNGTALRGELSAIRAELLRRRQDDAQLVADRDAALRVLADLTGARSLPTRRSRFRRSSGRVAESRARGDSVRGPARARAVRADARRARHARPTSPAPRRSPACPRSCAAASAARD